MHKKSRLLVAMLGLMVSSVLSGCFDDDRFRCYTDSVSTGFGGSDHITSYNCGVSYFF